MCRAGKTLPPAVDADGGREGLRGSGQEPGQELRYSAITLFGAGGGQRNFS